MDSYGYIDSIQVEKANAIARYKRFKIISILFRVIEVLVVVGLISWLSTHLPTVFKLSSEYVYACSSYVLNQHVVFVVGNLIVVLCYMLSDCSRNRSDSSEVSENVSKNVCEEVLEDKRSTTNNYERTSDPVEHEVLLDMKDKSTEEQANENINKVVGYEKTELEVTSEERLLVDTERVIKQAVKRIERFQRTQSAKLSREISMKGRKELRRSVTEGRKSVVVTSDGDSKVERLSNEEFRVAVEAFISKQQSSLKEQTM